MSQAVYIDKSARRTWLELIVQLSSRFLFMQSKAAVVILESFSSTLLSILFSSKGQILSTKERASSVTTIWNIFIVD